MSLEGALTIAASGLANINAQLALVSNNVANANTPDYVTETGQQEALVAGTQPLGVRTLAATRNLNLALQQSLFAQSTTVSGLTTTTASLRQIDAILGTPGQDNDLASLLGKVQDAFSTLLGDPSSGVRQSAVVTAAGNLTNAINSLSNAYTSQRQAAEDDIVAKIASVNADLGQVGSLSDRIIAAKIAGQPTADLENQRDAVVHALSDIVGVRSLAQPNGDMIVSTDSGVQLPTRASVGPLQTGTANVEPGVTLTNGGIPAIALGGIDITSQLRGGSLGADITLRDSTLPTYQAELDEFSFALATRFDAQGLRLFSDPTGNVPAGGTATVQATYVGFAAEIQVNPAVLANPALVRDGTENVAGSGSGGSNFTVNPPGGPAGFTTLISRILNFALGPNVQQGVPQPPIATGGLGPDGTLAAPYPSPATLADAATALVAAQAGVSATATNQLSTEQTIQTALTNQMNTTSGVNIDTQMSLMIVLQNAYGANARIIGLVQTLFTQLLQVIQ
jgi:flagellar hook-associated protein 1 FlgK